MRTRALASAISLYVGQNVHPAQPTPFRQKIRHRRDTAPRQPSSPLQPRPIRERRKTMPILLNDAAVNQIADQPNEIWCVCRSPEHGRMIFCENTKCIIQWFHFDCMRIKNAPRGDWYCPNCRMLLNKE